MPITEKDNILVLYALGNADSLTFAQTYQTLHDLDNDQLLGLSCSTSEIIANYATFKTQIEDPVYAHINDAYNTREYKAILVGYGVPGGFIDGGDTIATSSRLSRVNYTYSKKTANPLFNRRIYEDFSSSDAGQVLVCSRIDAPTIDVALSLLSNTQKFIRQKKANGKLFFDPYTALANTDEVAYFNELIDFRTHLLPILNVPTFNTVFWDEYTDVPVPRLKQDSFMWAWKSDRAGYTFFQDSNTARVFLYNADSDSAGVMRDADDRRFPMLAISSGYVGSAGAMSDPTVFGHLRPTPFFEALFNGAAIGEAFTFACPFVDWTVGCIGDPLVQVQFPQGSSLTPSISPTLAWEELHDHLASSIAYQFKRETALSECHTVAQSIGELDGAVLLPLFETQATVFATTWKAKMTPLIKAFARYSVNGDTASFAFDKYLAANGLKVSALLPIASRSYVAATTNQYDSGYWKVELPITTSHTRFSNYHFELDISLYSDFSSILYGFKSSISQSGWTYEKEPGEFHALPSAGVTSSYAGRRVRFEATSSFYIDRYTVYYWRLRQKDDIGQYTAYVSTKAVIYT